MSPTLKAEVDKLNANWTRLEAALEGPQCAVGVKRLGWERVQGCGRMRLCWGGTPIAECVVEIKINATADIPILLDIMNQQDAEMIERCHRANKIFEDCGVLS